MKYHIFIGSTLDDLKIERKELFRIIMEMGHIPVTADHIDFSRKNDLQQLQKIIEDCEYFVALTAYRYSPKDEEASPLEREYTIAARKGIPVIALIIDEKARWKANKKDQAPELIKKQEDFKARLQNGVYDTWLSAADLIQKTQTLLIREMNLNPRTGWIKANQAIEPVVANELARLSSENEMLRRQIKIEGGEILSRLREQIKKAIRVLALNKISISFYYNDGKNWENTRQFRYLRIFRLLVPELTLGRTIGGMSRFLGTVLNPDLGKAVRKDYPIPSNTVKKIMVDFAMLKLVKCGEGGGKEIWEVTEYGKELYSACRMRQLSRAQRNREQEASEHTEP